MLPHLTLKRLARKIRTAFHRGTTAMELGKDDYETDSTGSTGSTNTMHEIRSVADRPPTPRRCASSIYSRFDHGSPDLRFPIRRPIFIAPTFGSDETLQGVLGHNRFLDHASMLNAPSIDAIVGNGVDGQPAIVDNPPPFVRHSAPEPRQVQIAGGETLHQQGVLWQAREWMAINEERERLALRLEVVSGELSETQEQLEMTKEELTIRNGVEHDLQEVNQELREKCEKLTSGIDRVIGLFQGTARHLRDVNDEHAGCADREALLEMRIQKLQSCKFKSRTHLKRKIDKMQLRIQTLQPFEQKVTHLRIVQKYLREADDRNRDCLEQLQQQDKRIQELQRQHEEDAEELRLSRAEVFRSHQDLREVQRELRRQNVLVEVLVSNN